MAVGKSLPAFDAALLKCLSEIEIGDGGPLAAGFVTASVIKLPESAAGVIKLPESAAGVSKLPESAAGVSFHVILSS